MAAILLGRPAVRRPVDPIRIFFVNGRFMLLPRSDDLFLCEEVRRPYFHPRFRRADSEDGAIFSIRTI